MYATMLRVKGRWRSWLGLKGKLWYYSDEAIDSSRGLWKHLPSLVALASIAVSGYLSYLAVTVSQSNLVMTEKTFLYQHRPHVTIQKTELYLIPNKPKFWSLRVHVINDGETTAQDLWISGHLNNIIPYHGKCLPEFALPGFVTTCDVGPTKDDEMRDDKPFEPEKPITGTVEYTDVNEDMMPGTAFTVCNTHRDAKDIWGTPTILYKPCSGPPFP